MRPYSVRIIRRWIRIVLLVAILLPAAAMPAADVQAAGGITLDGVTVADTGTSSGMSSLSFSHTIGSGSNRLLLVGVSINLTSPNNPNVSSVTYGSQSLTLVGSQNDGNNKDARMEIWRLLNPPAGPATVAVTLSGSAVFAVGAASFFGVNQSTPLGTFQSAGGNNGSLSVSVPSVAAGELVFDTAAIRADGNSLVAGSGQTVQWNRITSCSGCPVKKDVIGAASTKPGPVGGGTVTMTWVPSNGKQWALGAVAIKPAPPAPIVNSVSLTDASLTPQMPFVVTVNVDHDSGKTALNTIVLKIYYDADGGTPSDAEAEAQVADTKNAAIITWTEATNTFSLAPSSGTTWALGSCSSPASLPGNFTFTFTPGKVATRTTGAGVWQVWAKATDDAALKHTNYDATPPAMNWYGEITINTPSVNWGTVAPGSDFGANVRGSVSVNYLSNGGYNEQVKADGTWSGGATSLGLNAAGTPGSGQFSLKADETANLASAVLLSTAYTTINSASQTGEAGNTETANTLWLKMGAAGIPVATYSGTIYYQIAP